MKTKIKYCSEDFLMYYKANFEEEYVKWYLADEREKFRELFNHEIVMEGDLEFNYQPLCQPEEFGGGSKYIQENAKRIYSMLQGLTPTQATKEELWFTMLHTVFLDYMMDYVQTLKHHQDVAKKITNVIFFNHGNIRSLAIQHLAKYWWISYKTYDAAHVENPFWLTDFFTDLDPTGKAVGFFSSKITNNPNFSLGIIEAIKIMCELVEVRNSKETYAFINEYFNFIGGVRILDIMTREEVKEETLRVIERLVKSEIEVPINKKKLILGANSKYLSNK